MPNIRSKQTTPRKPIELIFLPTLKISTHSAPEFPLIHFDQLAIIAQHHHTTRQDLPQIPHSELEDNGIPYDMIREAILNGQLNPRLTRKFLQAQEDWEYWIKSESKKIESYEKYVIFVEPCQRPPDSNVLPLIWTYLKIYAVLQKKDVYATAAPG